MSNAPDKTDAEHAAAVRSALVYLRQVRDAAVKAGLKVDICADNYLEVKELPFRDDAKEQLLRSHVAVSRVL